MSTKPRGTIIPAARQPPRAVAARPAPVAPVSPVKPEESKELKAVIPSTPGTTICEERPPSPERCEREECDSCSCRRKHAITLQLADGFGVPVPFPGSGIQPTTQFTVLLDIYKRGGVVTLGVPGIGFQTGPQSGLSAVPPPNSTYPPIPPPEPKGYLVTAAGRLPEDVRPDSAVDLTWLAAADDGVLTPFVFFPPGSCPPNSVPKTIAGFKLGINIDGEINIKGIGLFGDGIPAGNHQLLPTTTTYFAGKVRKQKYNVALSTGFTNTTLFPDFAPGIPQVAVQLGVRDSHLNDAFGGLVAFAWTDNSQEDQTAANNPFMDVFVWIGKVVGGVLVANPGYPFNLTKTYQSQIPPTYNYAWDTSITISRSNPDTIVVSWAAINALTTGPPGTPPQTVRIMVASNHDGGATLNWNVGPTNVQSTAFEPGVFDGPGDNPGVQSDQYGNIWYLSTSFFGPEGEYINLPFFMVSSDGSGDPGSWELVYTLPYPNIFDFYIYDFPEFSFGGDGSGNYGLWANADYGSLEFANLGPTTTFIPITGSVATGGLSVIGTPRTAVIQGLFNVAQTPGVAASYDPSPAGVCAGRDGRYWLLGQLSGLGPGAAPAPASGTNVGPRLVYKSPSPPSASPVTGAPFESLNLNYAGPWDVALGNYIADLLVFPNYYHAQPTFGFINTVRTLIFDNARQALYALVIVSSPSFSQDVHLYLLISVNNGQTWTKPFQVANTSRGSRGFQSMALDTQTGALLIGWYDTRNSAQAPPATPTFTNMEYFATVITAPELDELVKEAGPKSNPVYTLPSASASLPPSKFNYADIALNPEVLCSTSAPTRARQARGGRASARLGSYSPAEFRAKVKALKTKK